MVRVAKLAASLALGGLVLAGLYWALLSTPESNALMLTLSVLLVIAIVVTAAMAVNGAVLLARGEPARTAMRRGARGIPWFVVALLPVVFVWWDVLATDAWVARHSGEINAWFIAQFDWTDITWLFTAETWLSRWLRWAFAPVVGLCLLQQLLDDGPRVHGRWHWLRRALHWRTLGLATVVFVLFFTLPWQLTAWRPELPPTWVQTLVAGLRLGAAAVFIVVGCALLVMLTGPATAAPPSTSARVDPAPATVDESLPA